MKSNYDILGNHIRLIDTRNRESITDRVLGINIDKFFMPSVANVIGTDLSKYKLITKGKFACNPMHVGRDERLPVALYDEEKPAIVSPAYFMFEVIDNSILNEDYLMMWFRRPEFDRICWLHTDGSVRGGITWDDICRLELPIPPIENQLEIVNSYKTITERIALKQKINDNLDDTAQTLYQKYFESNSDKSSWKQGTVGDVLQLQRGHDLPRTEMTGGKYPVAGSTGTIGYHDEFTAEAPVIVMGRSGNIGNPRLYLCNCWTHNTSLYVKQIYEAEPLWVFYLLKNLNYDGFVGGSAVPTLNRNDVHAYGIAIPPLELQKSFSQKVMSLIYCKEENLSEIEKLQELQKIILTTMSSR
ncbi:restriction endonuclease subunit S [Streptococcus suis]|mgnify:CR=1 FL=1|jgi:type I restriction enzyme S subunit|uniref:restriction endonuclease subunit S n=1 Tax=Streptococcus suis TaxID=1307 RepID=UPI0005CD8E3F|nr:restriction endonuclease subunit S [Streptococcus suis]NQG56462.1 restriction endonuclease subunit S [Streptococcus suis]NQG61145.1 restriction endonuclease subunit S [Streptococcus suis]NQG63207.1 restriction endonuclease subunit S [Streptococcus suis]CYV55024.1 type I restriction-modification system subunit S [Streptococcus suis]CYV56239.1 type I restriction-modification system subunit S [Streptococcus suis]